MSVYKFFLRKKQQLKTSTITDSYGNFISQMIKIKLSCFAFYLIIHCLFHTQYNFLKSIHNYIIINYLFFFDEFMIQNWNID